mmetsp:Transcript_31016/g.89636  ORF Transcript_31016/g.89636 Transcript_31016/m.89636 type:complete len:362 (-) Transcript_31016:101-1186(-)|eukprot:CAMPEP_0176032768 /NCGR_PEP_ID=MMETSP0120_2-20121206/16178_1 /TAXON_ID=160619 /ORGANISM="Kryptoperidinium foliaceum, Strain CCMP 1326" /LENGTH=361 /DNA_ID=CAMNT_0017366089 /DNA_START=42 /DNA_END=1127 /DNA_ORIENTATION=-
MAFSERLTSLLNAAATSTALGVASRTGLLKALAPEPATAQALADEAGLARRYVEELLAVLVCGEVVVLDEGGEGDAARDDELRYSLPADRKEALNGMGLYFEELPLLCQCAFSQVCEAAASGAGVPPERYAPFGTWMGKLADGKHERQLCNSFVPALCGGEVANAMRSGACVVDLGCGEGTAARLLATDFPDSHVIGVDISAASVEAARAQTSWLENLEFIVADASTFANSETGASLVGTVDVVFSFDAIHDLPDPMGAMRTARALLRPGSGVFVMVDIKAETGLKGNVGHSMAPFLYAVSLMHCMPQGLNCDASGQRGHGLGMMWGRGQATAMLKQAGFASVEVLELSFDAFNDVFVARA